MCRLGREGYGLGLREVVFGVEVVDGFGMEYTFGAVGSLTA